MLKMTEFEVTLEMKTYVCVLNFTVVFSTLFLSLTL